MTREIVNLQGMGEVRRFHFTRQIIRTALGKMYNHKTPFSVYYDALCAAEHLRGHYIDELGTKGAAQLIAVAIETERSQS